MPKAPPRRPLTFDHLRAKQPLEKRVQVVLSQEALEAYEEAQQALDRARLTKGDVEAAQTRYDTAKAKVTEQTVELRFRSIGRRRYEELVRAHPPTAEQEEEQKEAGGQAPPYNPDTFAPALIAASCVEPEMTSEEAQQLLDEWTTGEALQLFATALEVSTQRRVVDLGKASNGTRG